MEVEQGNNDGGGHQDVAPETERRVLKLPRPENNNGLPQPLNIPTEIWEQIFGELELKDIKAVREAWRQWTDIAARFLFKTFTFRLDKKDLELFEQEIAQRPDFLAGIRKLRFETGAFNLKLMQERLGFYYLQLYNGRQLEGCSVPLNTTDEEVDLAKCSAVEEYAAWNIRWHEYNQNFRDLPRLKLILGKLRTLDEVTITPKQSPFQNSLLNRTWSEGDRNDSYSRLVKEFITLLLALQSTSLEVKHLFHDMLSVGFFSLQTKVLKNLAKPLEHLSVLHLSFGATTAPHPRFWNGLGQFLICLPNIQDLRFGFAPIEVGLTNSGMWQYTQRQDFTNWYVPLWEMLGQYTWTQLARLRLDGLMLCEAGLVSFLGRHSATLKDLEFYNIGLWSGDFQGLFTRLRDIMRLDRFHIWGVTRAVHSVFDHWRFVPEVDFKDEVWSSDFKLLVKDRFVKLGKKYLREGLGTPHDVARRIEFFMTSQAQAPWPLHEWDTMWQPFCYQDRTPTHNASCQNCILPTWTIHSMWLDAVGSPLTNWRDFVLPDPVGVGEEDVIYFYCGCCGYDGDGFDEEGRNKDGVHYMDIRQDWQGVPDPISMVAARRIVLDGIVSKLPRYTAILESSTSH